MAHVFLDDFETGDGRLWDVIPASLAVTQAAPHEGKYSAADDLTVSSVLEKTIDGTSKAFVGFWLNANSAATIPPLSVMEVRASDNDGVVLYIRESGGSYHVRITLVSVFPHDDSAWYEIPASTWTFVAVACELTTVSRASLYIDGALQEKITGGASTSLMNTLKYGILSSGSPSGTIYLDTIAINDARLIYPLYNNGDDVFIIRPEGKPDVVCTLGNADPNNSFVVRPITIDAHDRDRRDHVINNGYAAPRQDQNLVDLDFGVAVFGINEGAAIQNERVLADAMMNPDGGVIE